MKIYLIVLIIFIVNSKIIKSDVILTRDLLYQWFGDDLLSLETLNLERKEIT